MIHFKNICKTFKVNFWEKEVVALSNVSFSINKGELVGFLGANGAGKTTLIKILMDFSRATSGEIQFSPEMGEGPEKILASIGFLPEKAYLYQYLTGKEFLEYTCDLYGVSKEEQAKLIDKWTKRMNLAHAIERPIRGYSKGMQQRLGFISAVIHGPKLLVLDEPLSGLDPLGRREFKKILKELNAEGITIFFSSHIVSDVEEICNKVIFFEKGELVYEGSIDEIMAKNSSDEYKIKYLENKTIQLEMVGAMDKQQFLESLITAKKEILEVEQVKPTLEEIIYKIKK